MGAFDRPPYGAPMIRGKGAFAPAPGRPNAVGVDKDARWSWLQTLKGVSSGGGIAPISQSYQLVRAYSDRPQTWGVFLQSDFITSPPAAGGFSIVLYQIVLGNGQTNSTFQYAFINDVTAPAAPVEQFDSLRFSTDFLMGILPTTTRTVFKELSFPAREIQISAIAGAFNDPAPGAPYIMNVLAAVSPTVLVY